MIKNSHFFNANIKIFINYKMINITSQQKKYILYALIAFLVYKCMYRTSGYMLSMRPIEIETSNTDSIFDLPVEMRCTPGLPEGSAYTKDLTPGGVCGAQALVAAQGGGYTITGGIGVDDEPPIVVVGAGDIIST